jgi:hypothetical protein
MADLALRPRSPTELVDAAIQLYRREPLPFIVAVALAYAPLLILLPVVGFGTVFLQNAATNVATILLVIAVGVVVYILVSGLTVVLASELYLGRTANLGKAFATVGRTFGSMLGAIVALGIVMVLVAVPVMLGAALFRNPIVAILGVLVVMAVEVYVAATFFAVKHAVLLEGVSSTGALGRSAALTKGERWHVMGTIALVVLLNMAVTIGIVLVASMIPSLIVQAILQFAATTIVYPLIGIVQTALYYDLRIRREGFDIEYLASAFEQPPAPT